MVPLRSAIMMALPAALSAAERSVRASSARLTLRALMIPIAATVTATTAATRVSIPSVDSTSCITARSIAADSAVVTATMWSIAVRCLW